MSWIDPTRSVATVWSTLGVVSRGSGSHRINRAKSWTFQRPGALHQTLPLGAILVVSSFGA